MTKKPARSGSYLNYFNTVATRALGQIGSELPSMVVIVHGDECFRTLFAGGETQYRRTPDQYRKDVERGSSPDNGAVIVTKSIRGRNDVRVLVANDTEGTASRDELRRAATVIVDKMVPLLKDVRL